MSRLLSSSSINALGFEKLSLIPQTLFDTFVGTLDQSLMFSIRNSDDQYIYVSQGFIDKMCIDRKSIIGNTRSIFGEELHNPLFWSKMKETLSRSEPWRGEIRFRKSTGEIIWTESQIISFNDKDSSNQYYLEFQQDITSKKIKGLVYEASLHLQKRLSVLNDRVSMVKSFLNEIHHLTECESLLWLDIESTSNETFDFKSLQIHGKSPKGKSNSSEAEWRDYLQIFNPLIQGQRTILIDSGHSARRGHEFYNPMVHKFESFLGISIKSGFKSLGVLGLINRPGGFTQEYLQSHLHPLIEVLIHNIDRIESLENQKKLENETHQHLILLEQSQEVAGIGGWIVHLETQEMFWTRQLYLILGCEPTKQNQKIDELFNFVDSSVRKDFQDLMLRLLNHLEGFDVTYPVDSKHGNLRWVRIVGHPQLDNGKIDRVIGVLQDVSQVKRRDHQLNEQKKVALANSRVTVLGQMAGGIAHEINNPLTIVLGTSRYFKMSAEKGELNLDLILSGAEKIATAANRIAKVMRGMKDFSREANRDPLIEIGVQAVLRDTFSFCETRIGNHGISLEIPQIPEELKMKCRPTEISQALLNLLLNSDRTVRETKNSWIRVNFSQDNIWSIFRVTDSGPGISQELAEQMMEPFYVSKEFGAGVGFGLSLVRSIILGHSGEFFVDSSCPNASFVFKIPRFL